MPSIAKQKNFYITDYIAIIFAILFTPLLIIRSTTPELVQLSSDIPIFTDNYFKQVKAPIIMGSMNQYIEGRYYNIPHFLIPGYSKSFNQSFIDAVAFVGLQKEMLYSQRLLGLKYKTPYTQYKTLLTNTARQDDIEHQSLWKNQTYYFSNYTNCSGPINYMYQDKDTGMVLGITTEKQIFMMNNQLHLVFSTDSFKKVFDNVNEKLKIKEVTLLRTYTQKENVLVTIQAVLEDKSKILMIHKLDLLGQTLFTHIYKVCNRDDKSEIILQELQLQELDLDDLTLNTDEQVLENDTNKYGNLQYLRRAISYQIDSKHNELSNVFIVPKDDQFNVSIIVIKYKNQYHIINNEEGQYIASFDVTNGVTLYTVKDQLYAIFISDTINKDAKSSTKKVNQKFDIISLQISGDNTKQMQVSLNFIQYASEEHAIIEKKMKTDVDNLKPTPMVIVQPVAFTDSRGKKQIVMLTPNGMLISLNALNGYKYWAKSVNQFIASTINAHLSIQSIQSQQIIILSIGMNTDIYNAKTGHLLGKFTNDKDLQLYDTQKDSYNDVVASVQQQIIVEKMHPYGNKKAIVLLRGKTGDVITLGQSGVALTNFWERVMLVSLVSFIVATVLRLFVNTMYVKE